MHVVVAQCAEVFALRKSPVPHDANAEFPGRIPLEGRRRWSVRAGADGVVPYAILLRDGDLDMVPGRRAGGGGHAVQFRRAAVVHHRTRRLGRLPVHHEVRGVGALVREPDALDLGVAGRGRARSPARRWYAGRSGAWEGVVLDAAQLGRFYAAASRRRAFLHREGERVRFAGGAPLSARLGAHNLGDAINHALNGESWPQSGQLVAGNFSRGTTWRSDDPTCRLNGPTRRLFDPT